MSKKPNMINLVFVFVLSVLFCFLFKTESSYALDSSSISAKAFMEGVYQCANGGAYKANWPVSEGGTGLIGSPLSEETVKLPYGQTKVSDNNLNCKKVLKGGDGFAGLLPNNIKDSAGGETVAKYYAGNDLNGVKGVGYRANTESDVKEGDKITQLIYDLKTNTSQCYDRNGELSGGILITAYMGSNVAKSEKPATSIVFPKATTGKNTSASFSTDGINVPAPLSGNSYEYDICGARYQITDMSYSNQLKYSIIGVDDGFVDTVETVKAKDGGYMRISNFAPGSLRGRIDEEAGEVSKENQSDFSYFVLEWLGSPMAMVSGINRNNGAGYSVSGLNQVEDINSQISGAGANSYATLALSDREVFDLYKYYVTNVFKAEVVCSDSSRYDSFKDKTDIKWKNGAMCKIDMDSPYLANPENVYGVDGNNHFTAKVDLNNIVDKLNSLDIVDPEAEEVEPDEGTQEDGGEYDDDCYNAGVDGVSWIMCPAVTNLTYTANGFDGIIDSMLEIKPEYYNSDSDAHTVWETMRNIANVAMILILLVIIISQITGYGIDNYGIKKMLPKFVIMAIVINFSFLFCELIIDLSNIIGVGLRDVFGNLGRSIGDGVGKGIGEIISVLLGIAGGVGAAAGAGIGSAIAAVGIVSGPMIILMIVMALLGVVVSLLIFFASLGIRLMLVIICIGLVPLAAVCYILPNTKKAFDAWWKAFKACLIIYPICGAILGISELIKGIAWSSNGGDDPSGIAMKLVALIAPYLPFFILPSLLRGAIGAVGNLSGAINNISERIRGTARSGVNAVRNTESFKEASNAIAMQGQNRAAMRTISKLKNRTDLTDNEKLRLGRARRTLIDNQNKMNTSSSLSNDVAYEAAKIGLDKKADAESLANYMTLVNDRTRNGEDENALFSMYDNYLASGDTFGALAVARIAGRRKDTAARFMDSKIATTNSSQIETNRRNSSIFNKVAKEIATGDNAKNYRAADGVGFEYASQVNSGTASSGPDFGAWANSSDNIKAAAQHHITSRGELMGMKGSALDNLENYVHGGTLTDAAEIKRIEDLASQAIANRNEAGSDWDSTKAEQLAKLSGRYIYDKNTNTFRERSGGNPSAFVSHGIS